ncbi:hypothetical protein [Spiroplasma mirum]|nr:MULTISPECIES: hypothetical protein [Spiroplasma]
MGWLKYHLPPVNAWENEAKENVHATLLNGPPKSNTHIMPIITPNTAAAFEVWIEVNPLKITLINKAARGGFITMSGIQLTTIGFLIGTAILLWLAFALLECAISIILLLGLKYLKTKPVIEKYLQLWTLNILSLVILPYVKKQHSKKTMLKKETKSGEQ